MLRINRIAAVALALFLMLSGVCEGDLIRPEEIVQDTANYKTCEVHKGEFIKTMQTSAAIYYPESCTVLYEGSVTARFVEYNVKRDTEVKKGDLLMTLTVDRDEVAITRMNMEIERAEQDYAAGRLSYEEQLADKDKEISAATDAYQREIRMLEKEKIVIAYEKYRYETENSIADRRQNLEKLLESYENCYIYAPMDGIVSQLTYFRNNENVYNGAQLMVIYNPNVFMLQVKDGGALRYNMPVNVAMGQNKNRVSGTGRVVAAPGALPGSPGSGTAYIRIEAFDDVLKSLTSPAVTYMTQYLGNIYVVDRHAVTLYGGRNYVYKLSESGMVSKRYVNYVYGNNATGAFILDGVTEGELLILD